MKMFLFISIKQLGWKNQGLSKYANNELSGGDGPPLAGTATAGVNAGAQQVLLKNRSGIMALTIF